MLAESIKPLPLTVRKVIGRLALDEAKSSNSIKLYTSIPNEVVDNIANEEKN